MQPRSRRADVSIDECPLRAQSVFRRRLATEKSTVTGNAFLYKTLDVVFADTQENNKICIIPYNSPTSEWSRRPQLTSRIDPTRLPKDFSYEPELFPAVMFRRHGMHFICHLSGKKMKTGIKRSSDLNDI
jgi:hypothetical protein